jgi:hypothetical protein
LKRRFIRRSAGTTHIFAIRGGRMKTNPRNIPVSAADLIESLQAQLAEYEALAAEYGIDGKTMLTLAKSQIRTAQDNIKLREQLAASQRRADAAQTHEK